MCSLRADPHADPMLTHMLNHMLSHADPMCPLRAPSVLPLCTLCVAMSRFGPKGQKKAVKLPNLLIEGELWRAPSSVLGEQSMNDAIVPTL